MTYSEAFLKLIDQYGLDIMDNSFLLSSFISDYIKNSPKEERLLEAYLLLNKDNHIYQSIRDCPLEESKKIIKEEIDKLSDAYSASEYIKSIEPLLLILYKDEYKLMGDENMANIAINSVNIVDDYEEELDEDDEEDEEDEDDVEEEEDLDDYVADDEDEDVDYVGEDSDSIDTEAEETNDVDEGSSVTSDEMENLDSTEDAVKETTYVEETPEQVEEETSPKSLSIKIGPRIRNTYIRIGSTSNNYYGIDLSFNRYVPIENIVKSNKIIVDESSFPSYLAKYKGKCVLDIPRDKYDEISIVYQGKSKLKIHLFNMGDNIVNKLSIDSNGHSLMFKGKVNNLDITQDKGKIRLKGNNEYLNINGLTTDVKCLLNPNNLKQCNVNTLKGNIGLSFYGCKIHPKVNESFKTINKAEGIYKINDNDINMLLNTSKGKAKVG
ncbi:MAG: hypothetical protein MR467_04905 [Bacillales bacterium]|nr:hypothetical protein [Bacillales bacterium]MDY4641627.1 hypothetical protein [Erysipelotrichaceae bacterium]